MTGKPATVAVASDRCGDGHPRVEWRHGRIGAEGERRPRVNEPLPCVGSVGPAVPVAVGDIPVVHRVLGLHTRHDPEGGEAGEVLLGDQLCVFDAAAASHRLERIEGHGVGCIADGVHARLDSGAVRTTD